MEHPEKTIPGDTRLREKERWAAAHRRLGRPRRRPLVIAHRGDPAVALENTLGAFRSAIEAGADAIECDLHLTADGELVVFHDYEVSRLTTGRGPVALMTLKQVRRLQFRNLPADSPERIPTLQDLLEIAHGRVGLALELKTRRYPYPGIEWKLVEVLREAGAIRRTTVISFNLQTLLRLQTLEPRLRRGPIYDHPVTIQNMEVALEAEPQVMVFEKGVIEERWSSWLDERAISWWVYAIDDPEEMRALRDQGAGGLISNRPGLCVETLARPA